MTDAPEPAPPVRPAAAGGTMYDQQPSRAMSGCILVPVAGLAIVFTLTTLALVAGLVKETFSPSAHPLFPEQGMAVAILVPAAFALFFGWVARGLLATVRGKPVPHLFPPIIGIVLATLLGLGCLAALFMKGGGGYRAGGVGVVFLIYAFSETRKLVQGRKRATGA